MKKRLITLALTGALLLGTSAAQAIPTLQLGSPAPTGSGQGTYVDYTTQGVDEETAFIAAGYTLLAAGSYANNPELQIGGKYTGGSDWSAFDLQSDFDGKGAIIVATIADGSRDAAGVSVTLNGNDPFLKLDTFELSPNNHYPTNQARDFLFFDIGNFSNNPDQVTNFADESGLAAGEVKALTVAITGLDTVHFDLMALITTEQGGGKNTWIDTTWDVNPNSKDVTWNGGTPVPEPATMLLLGTGLTGLAAACRRKKA